MPRRAYTLYLDSNVLSQATDPRASSDNAKASRSCLDATNGFCTLAYSPTVVSENGPERSDEPHLARRRLQALRGLHRQRIGADRVAVERLAWAILDESGVVGADRHSAIARDARHMAAAMLGGVNVFVSWNTKDFREPHGEDRRGGRLYVGAKAMATSPLPRIVTPASACLLIHANPPRQQRLTADTRRLYARQQYWSMRDYKVPAAHARAFITRKWGVAP
jgi:hypothetical protein